MWRAGPEAKHRRNCRLAEWRSWAERKAKCRMACRWVIQRCRRLWPCPEGRAPWRSRRRTWGLFVRLAVVIDGHGGLAWLKQLISAGGEFWCVMFHTHISTPMFGHYRCLRCNRVYPVWWKEPKPVFLRTTARISPQSRKRGNFGKAAWVAARDWLARIRSRRGAKL